VPFISTSKPKHQGPLQGSDIDEEFEDITITQKVFNDKDEEEEEITSPPKRKQAQQMAAEVESEEEEKEHKKKKNKTKDFKERVPFISTSKPKHQGPLQGSDINEEDFLGLQPHQKISQPKKQRHCSKCGCVGHDKRTCQE